MQITPIKIERKSIFSGFILRRIGLPLQLEQLEKNDLWAHLLTLLFLSIERLFLYIADLESSEKGKEVIIFPHF